MSVKDFKTELQKKEVATETPRPSETLRNNKVLFLLFLFFVFVSAYLRFPGIYRGLPYILNPRESANLLNILTLSKNPLLLGHFDSSPLFSYFNSVVLFLISGSFDLGTFINAMEVSPEVLYAPLRFISVIFGIGSVVLTYFIGISFGALTGVFASGFLAVSFLHVKYSQLFLPVSASVFFLLASVLCSIKYLRNRDPFSSVLSVLFSLLSGSLNPVGFISVLPLMFVFLLKNESLKARKYFIIFSLIAVLLNINLLFYFFPCIKYLGKSFTEGYNYYKFSSPILFFFSALIPGAGPIVWTASLMFIKYVRDYNLFELKILFSFPLFYLGLSGLLHPIEISHSLFLLPFLCIGGALLFNSVYSRWTSQVEKFAFIVLLLFAFYIPLKYSFKYNKITSLLDTRVMATEWVNENASGKIKIAWDRNSLQPGWTDAYDKKGLEILGADPEMFVDRRFYEIKESLIKRKDWVKVLKKKVDYVVVNSYDGEEVLRSKENTFKKKFYMRLSKIDPDITFNPYYKDFDKKIRSSLLEDLYSPYISLWNRERTGPLIKIYKF
jgi:hypothetical protein